MPNKLISLLLAICMLFCLSACGNSDTDSEAKNTQTESLSEGSPTVEENKTEVKEEEPAADAADEVVYEATEENAPVVEDTVEEAVVAEEAPAEAVAEEAAE